MNEEEKQAIEILRNFEPDDLVECSIYIQAVEKITNLIDKQQKEIEELRIIEKLYHYRIEEIEPEIFINKDEIKELKEKIHQTLDDNGITRGYQLTIDNYFKELLGE